MTTEVLPWELAEGRRRVVIEAVTPQIDGDCMPPA